MGQFVEALSLLGTRLISGKTKTRRLGLKLGSWQPSWEAGMQTCLMKAQLNSTHGEAKSSPSFEGISRKPGGEGPWWREQHCTTWLTHLKEVIFGQV